MQRVHHLQWVRVLLQQYSLSKAQERLRPSYLV